MCFLHDLLNVFCPYGCGWLLDPSLEVIVIFGNSAPVQRSVQLYAVEV